MKHSIALAALAFYAGASLAIDPMDIGDMEPMPGYYQEAGGNAGRERQSNHLAEHIDPFSGKVQLQHVDMVLPGEGGFDIVIKRAYASLDNRWPEPDAVGGAWVQHFGRVIRNANMGICQHVLGAINLPVLELPDGSRHVLYSDIYPNDGWDFITKSNWRAKCHSQGGLWVHSPDGTVYEMSERGRMIGTFESPQMTYYPKKITDRHGNYMTLTYSQFDPDNPLTWLFGTLMRVDANDGRSIEYTYENANGAYYLKSLKANGRTIEYVYEHIPNVIGYAKQLREVHLPEGRTWKYEYYPFGHAPAGALSLKKVTYPKGGTIEYEYNLVRFARDILDSSTAVTKKTTSDGGVWTFEYRPATAYYDPDNAPDSYDRDDPMLDRTTVLQPDGTRVTYQHMGANSARSGWVYAIGSLKTKMIDRPGNEPQDWAPDEYFSYGHEPRLISIMNNDTRPGYFIQDGGVAAPYVYRTRHNVANLSTTIDTPFESVFNNVVTPLHDGWGNPLIIEEQGSRPLADGEFSYTYDVRRTEVGYFNDTTKWIIGVKEDETISVGSTGEMHGDSGLKKRAGSSPSGSAKSRFIVDKERPRRALGDESSIARKAGARLDARFAKGIGSAPSAMSDLHPGTLTPVGTIDRTMDTLGRVIKEDRFGVVTEFTYDGAGNLETQKNALGITTRFEEYFRGIAQKEIHPEGKTIRRVVDSHGNITSQTDGKNPETLYSYDGLNRVTSITPPRNNATTVDWNALIGHSGGNRRVVRGNGDELFEYDGFERVTRKTYKENPSGDPVVQTVEYDPFGRRTFVSYPNSTRGTAIRYDTLGRAWQVFHDSDSTGAGASAQRTLKDYGNETLFTNEEGHSFLSTYRVYSDPAERQLMGTMTELIRVKSEIERNGAGLVLSIKQDGVTRTFEYDTRYFMTANTDPEVGRTTYGRDAVGNMIWKELAGIRTYFEYDDLNRLDFVNYADSTPDVRTKYYANDQIEWIDNVVTRRTFTYDTNKNLTREVLSIPADNKNFQLDYAYSTNDALRQVTYGSTRTASYSPDAWGRPTRAAPYVTALSRYPSGQLKTVDYANGVRNEIRLDNRLRPDKLKFSKSGTSFINSVYEYDHVGNVRSINDSVDSSFNRAMDYDNVNRLVGAIGPWGNGGFSYDGRGNIEQQNYGSVSLLYDYEPGSDRLLTVSGAESRSFQYDSFGNVIHNGHINFLYNQANRMVCARCGADDQVTYTYDGAGTRVKAQGPGGSTYFMYGNGGKLMWEVLPHGRIKEYFYLDGNQIAVREEQ